VKQWRTGPTIMSKLDCSCTIKLLDESMLMNMRRQLQFRNR